LDDGLAQGARPGDRAERPVSISGGASGSFVYDAHGRRVKQVVGGQTIYSVYSASGTLLYRDNAATSTATDYIRMGGRAIARVRGSDVEWTHADHLGSPAAATSAAGAVLWREDHTPFGEARQSPTGNADNEGFTGHIADAATGLVYMQARYYDPVVGRFLSSDPVGFVTGGPAYFNRYAYTANDPVNMVDPDGRAWGKAIRAGILLVRSGGNFREAGRQFLSEVGRDGGALLARNSTLAQRAEGAFNLVSPTTAKEAGALGATAAGAGAALLSSSSTNESQTQSGLTADIPRVEPFPGEDIGEFEARVWRMCMDSCIRAYGEQGGPSRHNSGLEELRSCARECTQRAINEVEAEYFPEEEDDR